MQNGIFKLFNDLLRDKDIRENSETIQVIFNGIKNVLGYQKTLEANSQKSNMTDCNFCVEAERSGLCDTLEELQRHQNIDIYNQT